MTDTLAHFRFYAELDDAHRPVGTVCAVHRSRTTTTGHREALVTVTSHPEGGLTWSAVAPAYLDARCREVSRTEAATIHPSLVRRLFHDLQTP